MSFIGNRLPHSKLNDRCPLEIVSPGVNISEEQRRYTPLYMQMANWQIVLGYTGTIGTYQVMFENRRLTVAKDPRPRTEQEPTATQVA